MQAALIGYAAGAVAALLVMAGYVCTLLYRILQTLLNLDTRLIELRQRRTRRDRGSWP